MRWDYRRLRLCLTLFDEVSECSDVFVNPIPTYPLVHREGTGVVDQLGDLEPVD